MTHDVGRTAFAVRRNAKAFRSSRDREPFPERGSTSAKHLSAECATVGQRADSAWSGTPVHAHICAMELALSSAALDSGIPTARYV